MYVIGMTLSYIHFKQIICKVGQILAVLLFSVFRQNVLQTVDQLFMFIQWLKRYYLIFFVQHRAIKINVVLMLKITFYIKINKKVWQK